MSKKHHTTTANTTTANTTTANTTTANTTTAPEAVSLASLFAEFSGAVSSGADVLKAELAELELKAVEAESKVNGADLDSLSAREFRELDENAKTARSAVEAVREKLKAVEASAVLPETDKLQTAVFLAVFLADYDYKASELQNLANRVLGFTPEQVNAGKNASLGQYGYFRRVKRALDRAGYRVQIVKPEAPEANTTAPEA